MAKSMYIISNNNNPSRIGNVPEDFIPYINVCIPFILTAETVLTEETIMADCSGYIKLPKDMPSIIPLSNTNNFITVPKQSIVKKI